MELSETLLKTPLAELSVEEFFSLMDSYRNGEKNTSAHLFDEDSWLSGYKSGKIDAAIRRVGSTCWFNKNMISNLLKP